MLIVVDLKVEKELDQKAMKECCGGRYSNDGLSYGGGATLMGKLEEWAYYKFWY